MVGNLISHLQPNLDLSECSQQVHDAKAYRVELYGFIDKLCLNCKGYTMNDASRLFCKMKYWHDSFPNLITMWETILVISYSANIAFQKGFSKHNVIKDKQRNKVIIHKYHWIT